MNRTNQKIKAHLDAARAYGQLSHARRLKVGAVIVRDDRVISIGYNGTPSGRDNNCETIDRSKVEVGDVDINSVHVDSLVSKPEVCHAEMNAIMFAAKHGVSTNGCDLIVTHSPCFECSKMIVQCGIKNLYYETEYRDSSAVEFLEDCGIFVKKINYGEEDNGKTEN